MDCDNKKTALFPGSFDPFTAGHKAVVEQALPLFDKIVIAVGENASKCALLRPQKRVELIRDVFGDNPKVEIVQYNGLTGDECRRVGAKWIVRGIRNTIDFEYEHNIEQVNKQLFPEIETVMFCSNLRFTAVSSSTIREILHFGGDATPFLPEGIDLDKYTK